MDNAQLTGNLEPIDAGRINTAAEDVLDLLSEFPTGNAPLKHEEDRPAGELSMRQYAPGFVQREFRAMKAWTMLIEDRTLPLFGDLRQDDPTLFSPYCVTFELREAEAGPTVTFIGSQLAALCSSGLHGFRSERLAKSSLLQLVYAKSAPSAHAREPHQFEIAWIDYAGRHLATRGFVLPFSYRGERVDFLLVTIAPPEATDNKRHEVEMTLEDNEVLLLDQELDPDTGPHLASPPAISPFILVRLPELEEPARQTSVPERSAPSLTAPTLPFARREAETDALAASLRIARTLASAAADSEARSHGALYDAIGAAHDLAIAAARAPGELARILDSVGIKVQPRSPLTAIVKLVFASDYDKTRIAEYTAALAYANRLALDSGELGPLLRNAGGGLKGIVAEERRLRKADAGLHRPAKTGPSKALARRLRAVPAKPIDALSIKENEFVLVLARRNDDGPPLIVGTISDDVQMLERAARKLLSNQA